MFDLTKHSLYKRMEADSVLSNIFNIYLKKFPVLIIFSFIAAFLIQMTFYQLGFFELSKINNTNDLIGEILSMRKEIIIASLVYFFIYGILISVLINYIIKIDLNPAVTIGSVVTESIKKFSIHLVFFLLIASLMIILGSVIGMLILYIGFFVALPYLGTGLVSGPAVIVAEEKNAIETIRRSFSLVHKDFWATLGTLVLFFLIMILISFVLSAIMAIPFAIKFIDNFHETGHLLESLNVQLYDIGIWTVVINSIVSALIYPFYAILSVVLYFKLKYIEDERNLPKEI